MEVFEAILSRKSVRSYTGDKVSEEDFNKILLAGQATPVGMGRYDKVHISVIEDRELLDAIDANGAEFLHIPDGHPLYGAPTLILVSTKEEAPIPVTTDYSNAAVLLENMALAAVDLGIGHCLIWGTIAGLNQRPDLVEKLKLPEGFRPSCGIVIGKTEDVYETRDIPLDRISVNYVK